MVWSKCLFPLTRRRLVPSRKPAAICCWIGIGGLLLSGVEAKAEAKRLTWNAGDGGVWSTKEDSWTTDGGNGSNVPWANGETAVFIDSEAATGGGISISEEVDVADLDMSTSKASYTFQGAGKMRFLPVTDADNKRIYVIASQTIDTPVVLGGGIAALTLVISPASDPPPEVIINGEISETEPSALRICGGGTLVLNGTNTYTRGVVLAEGTLVLGNNTAAGTGVIHYPGTNNSTIRTSGGPRVISNQLKTDYMSTDGVWNFDGSDSLTIDAPALWEGEANTMEMRVAGNLTVILNNGIVSEGNSGKSLKKTSAGTLILKGEIGCTGKTLVEAGRLVVDGTTSGQGNWTIGRSGTISGKGELGLSAEENPSLNNAGLLSPGMDDAIATLTVLGNVTFSKESKYLWNPGAPQEACDLLNVAGKLSMENATDDWTLVVKLAGVDPAQFAPGIYTYTIATANGGIDQSIPKNAKIELDPRLPAGRFTGEIRITDGKLELVLTVHAASRS